MADNQVQNQGPDIIWRVRSVIAILTLVIVVSGICLFSPALFGSGLRLWALVSIVWGLGIALTWMAGRLRLPSHENATTLTATNKDSLDDDRVN